MNTARQFSIMRCYSEIEGLQAKSCDTYSLLEQNEGVLIRYQRQNCENTICEEKQLCNTTFETMRKVICFLCENSIRQGVWMCMVDEYCQEA